MALFPAASRLLTSQLQGVSKAGMLIKYASTGTNYEYILADKQGQKKNVGVITFNRPKALNALSGGLLNEVDDAIEKFDKDESIGAVVITGSEKVFAAGADLKQMQGRTFTEVEKENVYFGAIYNCKKPIIAAVNGLAFGGGCELAMACDIIYAGEKAQFGQPEVIVGTIPGAGGTQRLPRFIGMSKAMEMILTGIPITAQEAEKAGLVSKVFPPDQLVAEAVKLGEKISSNSQIIVALCKKSVKAAFETTLQHGLQFEKSTFNTTFTTHDRKEGMTAFIEKRAPNFKNN
ncbi:enoyl-CoA hydratase, mitochondrial-like [Periplaneta americana]|uniref:enoyl-CoA hydratase, mitochondrial-like n=1 Tax=Periplaneta americana TaxID=6978 RepID=UPI0037E7EB08